PLEISSAAITTWPSVVTTSRGIGGACRKISVPTHPNIANENTNIAIKISQSFFIKFVLYAVSAATSSRSTIAKLPLLPVEHFAVCAQTHIGFACQALLQGTLLAQAN